MNKETFDKLSKLIYRESGIVLPPEKQPLLVSRIRKRLLALGLNDESEYLKLVELDVRGEELINFVDVISTNVTRFYREADHFESLRAIFRGYREQGKSSVKVWCAAASSGEEPYTIAFEAMESLDFRKQSFQLLATDICTKVLQTAVQGEYSDTAVRDIPAAIKSKHMTNVSTDGESFWQVNPEVAKHVTFKKLNLVKFPYPLTGPIDIIFCRNVMIYFDLDTRRKVVQQLSKLLKVGGYLFLSHTENLLGIDHKLARSGVSILKKVSD